MEIDKLLESKTQTLMIDRFNSDMEDGIPVSKVKSIIKRCFKAQRAKCAENIKDMNFTLSELVRTTSEPNDI